jgi:hypothetical protein
MKRLVAGAVLLALGVAWARPASDAAGGGLAAFARSLGGLRVVVIDAVFLQAEAARHAGRSDDAADLYELVLALDPDDDAAGSYVAEARYDAVRQVPDVASRLAAFLALQDDLAATIARRTRKAQLLEVSARLLLQPLMSDPALAEALLVRYPRPRLEALRRLGAAALETGRLPHAALDLIHLRQVAYLAVEVAAEAHLEGDAALRDEVVDLGERVLALRRDLMAGQLEVLDPAGAAAGSGGAVALDELLGEGLACVRALRDGSPEAARRIAAYAARVGPTRGAARLLEAVR